MRVCVCEDTLVLSYPCMHVQPNTPPHVAHRHMYNHMYHTCGCTTCGCTCVCLYMCHLYNTVQPQTQKNDMWMCDCTTCGCTCVCLYMSVWLYIFSVSVVVQMLYKCTTTQSHVDITKCLQPNTQTHVQPHTHMSTSHTSTHPHVPNPHMCGVTSVCALNLARALSLCPKSVP